MTTTLATVFKFAAEYEDSSGSIYTGVPSRSRGGFFEDCSLSLWTLGKRLCYNGFTVFYFY